MTGRPRRDRRPILAALLAAALLTVLILRLVDLRTDMADFLPAGRTEGARLMVQQLRSGAAASLILAGIEAAPPAELARISREMAAGLNRSGLFAVVGNGEHGLDRSDEQFLFARRYLLSPVTTAHAFETPALRGDLERLLQELQSAAAPLAQRYGLADPPGAFLELARIWGGDSQVRTVDGVWFAPERDRALLLARTRAGGLDLEAQDQAQAALSGAFAAARPAGAHLLLAGPAVFARDAAHGIRNDVRLLSICSTALVAALLLWRFRSLWVLAVVAVPTMLGIAAAAMAVQLIFGFLHGITLGFGMTMLGVTVDYPVLLIGHRKQAEQATGTLRRIGPSFNLAVAAAALGLTGMAFSGFPGISQLGVFSVTGLLVAAATTRWLLPRLIVAADLAPVWAGDPARLLRIERLRAWRIWGLPPVAAAAVWLAVAPPRLERDLANLSPVPRSARDLDAELRSEIGAPDAAGVVVVRGSEPEDVLRREERLLPVIDGLQRQREIAGAEFAARFLPSAATQLARRSALPTQDQLAARLAAAQAGLPFRPEAWDAFLADVAASRTMTPVQLSDITNPLIAARLQPLLFEQGGVWSGLIVPREIAHPDQLAAAFTGREGETYVDMRAESNRLVAVYTAQAWRWLSIGGLAAIVALAAGLREPLLVGRVLLALAAAGLVTVAVLTAAGQSLSLIHIVSLQFVAGVGLDYAVFFARRQLDQEERARTLRTLVTCNAMTLLTFGLLALCRTPLLRQIGFTVAVGAVAAISFAFMFVGPARPEAAQASSA